MQVLRCDANSPTSIAASGRLRTPYLAALLVALFALGGCQGLLLRGLNAVDAADGHGSADAVEFASERDLALDVYRVADGHPAPVLVFFYGGSWRNGERGWYRFVGRRLAEAGLVTVIPDYRGHPSVQFPEFMRDAADALAWTVANIEAHGGDARRVYLMGHSAGAHVATLLATDPRYLQAAGVERDRIAGVVGLSGPYDFLPITSRRLRQVFPDPARWPDSQPLRFVDHDSPPMLLLHGADDRVVLPGNAERMAARLREAGVEAELHLVDGMGHAGSLLALSSLRSRPPLVDWIRAFVDRHAR